MQLILLRYVMNRSEETLDIQSKWLMLWCIYHRNKIFVYEKVGESGAKYNWPIKMFHPCA